ncbi:alpha/beta hydrolase fold protein [Pseudarthrobacter chlorophenolicus A6]|uniref:Alpha/beta hydrolase fold protein n=1 Tax=Pseudarthrobacter chlorophenolicus (strain ATCC 700700 / DSM 12829 / CIP 107037 / JCM 12360 / KCTC 9906 / NCIMB 13794 / A6) TaxID=452863 RepID=B8HDV1_PSECP|nr:alpha/beta hydrolase [Pseudarthrobacter chlorophenolicus]ACL40819.1 alpha/beta hydrolase fold protein [Pseudarthrobacter chlorophenolicus A6]SDQ74525.1 Pimeloyl-ACP methyl ester carboxylesterase [Pseudarthrobacter chlorophenolicus]
MLGELTAETVASRNNVTTLGRADGPVMLFAHGFGCDQDMWRRLVPYFAADYRVVLFDHVGAGHSDLEAYDREKYGTLDGYATDVLEICEALDLADVILVGHSVSAMIALIDAAREPERFARLILVAPSPRYTDDADDGYVGGFSHEDIEGLLESLDSNYFAWADALAPMAMGNPDTPEYAEELRSSICRTNPSIARHFARVTFLSDTRHILPRVQCDSLILQCTDDLLAPAAVGSYVHRQLGHSSLVQLRATGHCPHVSAPGDTAAAILHYLNPRP